MIDVRDAASRATETLRKLRRKPCHPQVLRVALARHAYLNDLHGRGVEEIEASEIPDAPAKLKAAVSLVAGSVKDLEAKLDDLDRDSQEIVRLARELEVFGGNRSSALEAIDGFLEDISK